MARRRRYRGHRRRARSWRRASELAVIFVLCVIALYSGYKGTDDTLTGGNPGDEPGSYGYLVVDGDSLRLGGENIRLFGIDAPELHQKCRDKNNRPYACGKKARAALKRLIMGLRVSCRTLDVDRYQRSVAVCKAGGDDINKAMVEDGWAVAYLSISLAYAGAEAKARKAKRGLWAGTFEQPADWRRFNRSSMSIAGGNQPAPTIAPD